MTHPNRRLMIGGVVAHPPRRLMIELAYHLAEAGAPRHWNPLSKKRWSPEWRAHTADLERLLRVWETKGSTCNVHVHGLLHAAGCLEDWVKAPRDWPPKPNAIQIWRPDQELNNPLVCELTPGDLLLWRATSYRAHIGVYLGMRDGLHLTSEGGQPGGRVKRRTADQLLKQLDYSVPLNRLDWGPERCPTINHWRVFGADLPALPRDQLMLAEDIVDERSLELADAPRM